MTDRPLQKPWRLRHNGVVWFAAIVVPGATYLAWRRLVLGDAPRDLWPVAGIIAALAIVEVLYFTPKGLLRWERPRRKAAR